jgi:hypothetical protein
MLRLRAETECGIVFGLGVNLRKEIYMKFIFCLIIAAFALEANAAECQNGRCGVRPVPKAVMVTEQVVKTTKNVAVGTVRVVTPPYGRCKNGRCYVR